MGTVVAVAVRLQVRRYAPAGMEMPGEDQPPQPDPESPNWDRLTEIEGTFAVRFSTANMHDPLFSQSGGTGRRHGFVPDDMFSNAARFRIDIVVGNADGVTAEDDAGDDYIREVINVSRGDSEFDVATGFAQIPDDWSWVLINETTEEWLMWPAADGFATPTTASYSVIPSFVTDADPVPVGANVVQAIAQSFSEGEELTAGRGFQNGLRSAVLVLALIPNNTFRPMFEEGPPPSNYERIAAMEGALAIRVNSRSGQSNLFDESSDEGELLESTPASMFDDESIVWLERLTGARNGVIATNDDGDSYRRVSFAFNRGDSDANVMETVEALAGRWAWVLINQRTEEWIMWPAAAALVATTGGAWQIIPSYIDDASPGATGVQAIAQSFSDGETLTAALTFQNDLRSSELVFALIPDIDFRPAFSEEEEEP